MLSLMLGFFLIGCEGPGYATNGLEACENWEEAACGCPEVEAELCAGGGAEPGCTCDPEPVLYKEEACEAMTEEWWRWYDCVASEWAHDCDADIDEACPAPE